MKKTLLIIILFIGLGNVNAQSDATIEETLNWLNEHSLPKQSISTVGVSSCYNNKIAYNENKKSFVFSSEEGITTKCSLDELSRFELTYSESSKKYVITLSTSANVFLTCFRYSNKDWAVRTFKSFEHLFKMLNHNVIGKNYLVSENKF